MIKRKYIPPISDRIEYLPDNVILGDIISIVSEGQTDKWDANEYSGSWENIWGDE